MKKSFLVIILFSVFFVAFSAQDASVFWKDGICKQANFSPVAGDGKVLHVNTLEGGWQDFETVKFPESYIEWNKSSRIEYISAIKQIMRGEGQGPRLEGPHNGMVASWGFKRDDASFSLNNAVKGMGFLPKEEKMAELIALLDSTQAAPMPRKLKILEGFYQNLEENFALDKQGSLELYSEPEFMTQTFLNQMKNPVSTVVFLDIPSYKLKTVARLLDPADPELTEYEKQAVNWINAIHNYFHGPFDQNFIAVIYYVIQVYDNSPMGQDPNTGMGRRIMPLMP